MDKKENIEELKDTAQDQVSKNLEGLGDETEAIEGNINSLSETEDIDGDQEVTRIVIKSGEDSPEFEENADDTKSETLVINDEGQKKIKESYDQEIGIDKAEQENENEEEEEEYLENAEEDDSLVATILAAIGNVAFSLFLILLIAVIGLNALSFAKGEDVEVFGKKVFIVGEDSMAPVIKENDAIIVEDLPSKSINQGDLIVYRNTDGQAITAWVNNVLEDDTFEIKKDINSKDSIIIDGIAIVGRAETSIANLGDFIDFISNPLSLLITLFVGIIIYVIVWFVSNKPRKKIQA